MEGWVGVVGLHIADTLPTKWLYVNHRSGMEGLPAKDRRPNHWATPPADYITYRGILCGRKIIYCIYWSSKNVGRMRWRRWMLTGVQSISVSLSTDLTMLRSGSDSGTVTVHIWSIGVFDAERNIQYTKDIYQFLTSTLRLPSERWDTFGCFVSNSM